MVVARVRRTIAWLLSATYLAAAAGVGAAEPGNVPRVLYITDQSSIMPGIASILRDSQAVIRAALPGPFEFHAEYLDAGRFPEQKLSSLFLDYVREKYARRSPDLIVAVGTERFDLLGEFATTVFPDVPIVLMALTEEEVAPEAFGPKVSGFIQRGDLRGTMQLILKLQPEVRRIVVIGGVATMDQGYVNRARADARSLEDRVAFEFWSGRSMTDLDHGIASLGRETAILYTSMLRSSAGETFVPREVAKRIVEQASVPVYGFYEEFVGVGGVGGSVFSLGKIGTKTGEFATRALQGHGRLGTLEVHEDVRPVFNGAALQRWGIDEGRLPPDSVIEFRAPSVWRTYAWYIAAALALIAVQAMMIVGLFVQRTRLRRAERKIRESHEFMELATDAGQLGLWARDLRSGEMRTNRRLRAILGFGDETEVGIEDLYRRIHPADRGRVLALFDKVIGPGERLETECRLVIPGGAERWVLLKRTNVVDAEGRRVRAQGVIVDQTESKLAELEADRQRAEAAHIQRVSMMGELAASLAHELNQPLTAILSNAQAAQRFLAATPPDLEEVREILDDVVKDNTRASEVILKLRALARKESLTFMHLDIAAIIRDVVQLTRSDAIRQSITVSLEGGEDVPPAWGDRVQLGQVVLNLLLNAFDSMKQNPVSRRLVVVRTTLDEDSHMVRVSVGDRGVGFPGDALDRLFEPFYTTKRDGMGMGLAISRSIIRAHGGELRAENNADGGATFSFTVKIDRPRTEWVESRPFSRRDERSHAGRS
jgi:signal transduction histidine kinase